AKRWAVFSPTPGRRASRVDRTLSLSGNMSVLRDLDVLYACTQDTHGGLDRRVRARAFQRLALTRETSGLVDGKRRLAGSVRNRGPVDPLEGRFAAEHTLCSFEDLKTRIGLVGRAAKHAVAFESDAQTLFRYL